MKNISFVAALVALASVTSAQVRRSPSPAPSSRGTNPPRKERAPVSRVDAIMGFASDRMTTQVDVLFDDGDYPAVISLLKLQAEGFPHDYDLWTNLGWMQENVQDYDAALATYVRYRGQNPNDPDRALPEANFYFMRKQYAKVPPLMEPAIKGRCHPNCFRILARSYEKLDLLADSARVYKALVTRDDDPQAKVNLKRVEGKIAQGTGR